VIRLLPRVAFRLWIIGFLVFLGAEAVHLEPVLRIATHLLYGIPLAVWAAVRLRAPWDALDLAVIGLLAVYAVVSLVGLDLTEGLGTLGLATAYAALFMLLRREARGPLRHAIITSAALGMTITLAFNAWLLIQEKITWFARVGGSPFEGLTVFPWESVNAMPILVLMVIPWIAWMPPGPLRTIALGVSLGSAIVVVPISMGRAGWLAIAVAAAAFVVVVPGNRARLAQVGPRAAIGAGAVMLGAATVALALLVPRLVASLGESGRILLWEQAVTMIGQRPILGAGPGTYSWARLEVGPDGANLLAVRLVHNVPLQTLIDGGILLGVAVSATLVAWVATAWLRQDRSARSIGDRVGAAALIGLAASTILDDFSYLPAVTTLVIAIAAFLAPVRQDTMRLANRGGRRGMPVAALAVFAVAGVFGVLSGDVARWYGDLARSAAVEGRWQESESAFGTASRWHPEHAGYRLGRGMAASYLGDDEVAIASYERASAISPGDPRSYGGLAGLTRDDDVEINLLVAATERTLGDPEYALRLGNAHAARGERDAAIEAWGRAVALDPSRLAHLAYADAGADASAVAAAATRWIAAHPRPAPATDAPVRWDIGLATDDLPSDAADPWLAVDAARDGNPDRGIELARAAISATPYAARGYQSLAAAAAFGCDQPTASEALRLEGLTTGAYRPLEPEPFIRREFVYREASLGPTQPEGVASGPDPGRWPWYLVDEPGPCA